MFSVPYFISWMRYQKVASSQLVNEKCSMKIKSNKSNGTRRLQSMEVNFIRLPYGCQNSIYLRFRLMPILCTCPKQITCFVIISSMNECLIHLGSAPIVHFCWVLRFLTFFFSQTDFAAYSFYNCMVYFFLLFINRFIQYNTI